MKSSMFRVPMICFSILAFAVLAEKAKAQDNPPLPPIEYELTFIERADGSTADIHPSQINNQNQVVGFHIINGKYRGFMNLPPTQNDPIGVFFDIADIVDTQQLTQAGWEESRFEGINDLGAIVGYVTNVDGSRTGILINTALNSPVVKFLPSFNSSDNRARRINNFGDIIGSFRRGDNTTDAYIFNNGLYDAALQIPATELNFASINGGIHVNNARQALFRDDGNGSRWYQYDLVAASFEERVFPSIYLGYTHGFNDSGQVCGYTTTSTGHGRNRVRVNNAYRFDTTIEWQAGTNSSGHALNNAGDVVGAPGQTTATESACVFHDNFGMVDLDQLVASDFQNDIDLWFNLFVDPSDVSDRDSTGFGTIVGRLYDGPGFVLIPTSLAPTVGISVNPISGLVTTETGGSDSFDIVLDTQPTADVTIGISTTDDTEGLIDDPVHGLVVANSLTFTPANWDAAQTIRVTGVDDSVVDPDETYTIVTSAATSADPDYNGLDADDVSVTNQDDEQAPTVTHDSDVSQNDVDIPDQGTAISTITVPDAYQVADVNVTLTIDHDRVQDLDVYLIDPDGTRIQLFTDVGGNGVNFSGTTLDDEAGTSITAGSAPFSGSFYPEGNLGAFDGMDTDGDWILEVTDDKRRKEGQIRNWSITFETN